MNICYANSALQVLYHCQRFRRLILEYKHLKPVPKDATLLILDLKDVFEHMYTIDAPKKQVKAKVLTVNIKKLMKKIKAMN